jgi:CRISPR/Cas system CSM-associated protein Csm2 small subunit
MKMDRSGRTLEDYRELFWAEQKESKRLSDGLVKANNISMAAEQVKQEFEAGYLRKKARVEELEAESERWQLEMDEACMKVLKTVQSNRELQAKLDAVEEYYRILEAKLDAVSNGLHLPKITPEIDDALEGSGLIENSDWTQDAVEFVCILAKAIGEQE